MQTNFEAKIAQRLLKRAITVFFLCGDLGISRMLGTVRNSVCTQSLGTHEILNLIIEYF